MNVRLHNRTRLHTLVLTAGLSGLAAAAAHGQTWDGGGSTNSWTEALNWNPNATPVSNGTANVAFGGSVRLNPIVNVGYDINSLAFLGGSGSFNIGGSGPLTVRGGGIGNGAFTPQTISVPLFVGAAQTWSSGNAGLSVNGPVTIGIGNLTVLANSLGPVTISGQITGPQALIKEGSGVLTIGAGAVTPNLYQGATLVNAGTLRSASANALPNASSFTVASGATLDLNGHDDEIEGLSGGAGSQVTLGDAALTISQVSNSLAFDGVISGSGGVVKSGSPVSVLYLGGANTYTGPPTIDSGTIRLTAGGLLSDSSDLIVTGGTFDVQTFTEVVDDVVLEDVPLNVIAGMGRLVANSYTVARGDVSAILDGPGSLTKDGGGDVTVSAACEYDGMTQISLGTLRFEGNGRLPIDGDVTIGVGGFLSLQTTAVNTIDSLNGSGIINLANTTLTVGSAMGTGVFEGVITDSGVGNFSKVGGGNFTLNGNADIVGTVSVLGGTFVLGPNANLGDGVSLLIGNNSVFDMTTGGEIVGDVFLSNGDIRVADPLNPPMLAANSFQLISGNVHARLGGSGGVFKSLPGTVRLHAPASYTGVTSISSGVYIVEGDEMLGAPEADLLLSSGRLQINDSTTLNRRVFLGVSPQIETIGHVTVPSIVSSGGGLEKLGAGTLTLPGNVDLHDYTINQGICAVPASGNLEVLHTLRTGVSGTLRVDGGIVRSPATGTIVNEGRLELSNGAMLDGRVVNAGIFTGSGRVTGPFENLVSTSLRLGAGQSMLFTHTGSHLNDGLFDVTGGSVEFAGPVTNQGNSGMIFSRAGQLRFNAGLTNEAAIAVSYGPTEFYGDITNAAGGRVVLSGFAQATFVDDVVNQGTIETAAGAASVFFGSVSGAGSFPGLGTVFMEGDLRPGNSPAVVEFGGDLVLGLFTGTEIELAGLASGQADQLRVGGDVNVDGDLVVSFIDGFAPTTSFVHTAIAAGLNSSDGGRFGEFFSVTFPEGVRGMRVRYTATGVDIVYCAGDFNSNTVVDSQDFFDFLTAFFALDASSDFNRDGAINSQDFFDFINAFFAGCP